jgi:hypothetical protein
MIAATAISDLPLDTTNPVDYAGLAKLVRVVPVTRPPLPHEERGLTAASGRSVPAA